jgi:hypothetical protein
MRFSNAQKPFLVSQKRMKLWNESALLNLLNSVARLFVCLLFFIHYAPRKAEIFHTCPLVSLIVNLFIYSYDHEIRMKWKCWSSSRLYVFSSSSAYCFSSLRVQSTFLARITGSHDDQALIRSIWGITTALLSQTSIYKPCYGPGLGIQESRNLALTISRKKSLLQV